MPYKRNISLFNKISSGQTFVESLFTGISLQLLNQPENDNRTYLYLLPFQPVVNVPLG